MDLRSQSSTAWPHGLRLLASSGICPALLQAHVSAVYEAQPAFGTLGKERKNRFPDAAVSPADKIAVNGAPAHTLLQGRSRHGQPARSMCRSADNHYLQVCSGTASALAARRSPVLIEFASSARMHSQRKCTHSLRVRSIIGKTPNLPQNQQLASKR
jgi:hypothetical protein